MHEFQSSFLLSNLHIGFFLLLQTLCMLPFDLGENKDAILSINTYLFYIHIQYKENISLRKLFPFSMINLLFLQRGLPLILDFLYEIYFRLVINLRLCTQEKLEIFYRQSNIDSVKLFLRQSGFSGFSQTRKSYCIKINSLVINSK